MFKELQVPPTPGDPRHATHKATDWPLTDTLCRRPLRAGPRGRSDRKAALERARGEGTSGCKGSVEIMLRGRSESGRTAECVGASVRERKQRGRKDFRMQGNGKDREAAEGFEVE